MIVRKGHWMHARSAFPLSLSFSMNTSETKMDHAVFLVALTSAICIKNGSPVTSLTSYTRSPHNIRLK